MSTSTPFSFALLFALAALALPKGLWAQDSSAIQLRYSLSEFEDSLAVGEIGSVRFIEDGRIETFNEYLKSYPPKHSGYRIQIVFGSKVDVENAKAKYHGQFNMPAYETYLAPNFRLRVGDFMTRLQAEKQLVAIKRSFPAAYIVKDRIEVPQELR